MTKAQKILIAVSSVLALSGIALAWQLTRPDDSPATDNTQQESEGDSNPTESPEPNEQPPNDSKPQYPPPDDTPDESSAQDQDPEQIPSGNNNEGGEKIDDNP